MEVLEQEIKLRYKKHTQRRLDDMLTKIYTIEEVVEILKVTRRTVYNYLKEGKLNAVKLGRSWRVTEEELNRFINSLK